MALLLYQPLFPTNAQTFQGIKPLSGNSYFAAIKRLTELQKKVILYEQDNLVERTLKTFSDAKVRFNPTIINLSHQGFPVGAIDGRLSNDEVTWFDSVYVSSLSTVPRISCAGGYYLRNNLPGQDLVIPVGGLADMIHRLEKLDIICVPVFEAVYGL